MSGSSLTRETWVRVRSAAVLIVEEWLVDYKHTMKSHHNKLTTFNAHLHRATVERI